MEPYLIALIAAVGVLAIIALILIIRKWGSSSKEDKNSVITQLYAIGSTILKSLKNDGKISSDELEDILTQVQALIAILRGENLDTVKSEFRIEQKTTE